MTDFSKSFHFVQCIHGVVLQPRKCQNTLGLGYSPVARRYWGNHFCFLLLQVLRCFSSLRLLSLRNGISSIYRVAPFGYLRIKGYLHLPAAFRSLSRPSSPVRAQASTIRSCSLLFNHIQIFTQYQFSLIPRSFSLCFIATNLLVTMVYISICFPTCQRTYQKD